MQKTTIMISMALLISACGSNSKGQSEFKIPAMESCAKRDGKVLTVKDWSDGCTVGNKIMVSANYTCKDGRKLYWNDWGWGYADDVAHAHVVIPGQQEDVPPKTELNLCRGIT